MFRLRMTNEDHDGSHDLGPLRELVCMKMQDVKILLCFARRGGIDDTRLFLTSGVPLVHRLKGAA